MKILVTGACGYKGNVLVPKLLKIEIRRHDHNNQISPILFERRLSKVQISTQRISSDSNLIL
jgi:hypothetical protein